MFQSVLTARMSTAQNDLNSSESPTPGEQVMRQEVVKAPTTGQEDDRSSARGQVRSGSERRQTCCNTGAGYCWRPAGAKLARKF